VVEDTCANASPSISEALPRAALQQRRRVFRAAARSIRTYVEVSSPMTATTAPGGPQPYVLGEEPRRGRMEEQRKWAVGLIWSSFWARSWMVAEIVGGSFVRALDRPLFATGFGHMSTHAGRDAG